MNDIDAARLVARYRNVWRGGPHTDELRAQFADLDAGTVGTVLVRLARSEEHPPSIARLWAEYRATHTAAVDPLPCDDCGGDGWVTAYTNEHGYRYAKPCPSCRLGERVARLDMRPTGPGFAALAASRARHPTAQAELEAAP